MDKLFNRLLLIFFLFSIFAIGILTLTSKPAEILIFDNRYPEKVVPLTWDSYKSGEFSKSAEKAFSDNIYKRDEILKLYVLCNLAMPGKNEVNKVVYGDNVLLPYYSTNSFDSAKTDNEIELMADDMKKLANITEENGGHFIFTALPEKFSMYENKFPSYVCNFSPKINYVRKNLFDALNLRGVDYIDVKSAFAKRADVDELYFATDHHYTFKGALAAYELVMNRINKYEEKPLKILSEQDIDFYDLPNHFLGSQGRKVYDTYVSDDALTIGYPKEKISYDRFNNGKKVDSDVFTKPQQSAYSNYECYMGGDIAETVIDTHREDLPSLLVFGDSYTNAMETLLYYGFDKMYSLDFRHYDKMSVADYIKKEKPDYVLLVRDDTIYTSRENNGNFFGVDE